MGGKERRRHRRYGARLPVELAIGDVSQRIFTEDVSFSGLFARTDDPPRLRQLIIAKLALPPDDYEFVSHAMCVFRIAPDDSAERSPGVGVQFYATPREEAGRWEQFVRVARDRAEAGKMLGLDAAGDQPDPVRRRFVRYGAVLEVHPHSRADLETFYTREVSNRGMFIETDEPMEVAAEVRIAVQHPERADVFDLLCAVRRVEVDGDSPGVGVEFLEMDDARREAFHKFVYSSLELPDEEVEVVDPDDPELV